VWVTFNAFFFDKSTLIYLQHTSKQIISTNIMELYYYTPVTSSNVTKQIAEINSKHNSQLKQNINTSIG